MTVKCFVCGSETELDFEEIPCLECDGVGCRECEYTGNVFVPNPHSTCGDKECEKDAQAFFAGYYIEDYD